jgi:hypothetical protein
MTVVSIVLRFVYNHKINTIPEYGALVGVGIRFLFH